MPIDLYYIPASAPCRAVRLTAAAVGVELNLKLLDLMAGEHLKPEFLKINPQHTIPTLDDNGFHLGESRAIMGYLVNQYGKNDLLYPKEPKARALVDRKLYFDIGLMYQVFADYYYPILFAGAPKDDAKFGKIGVAFDFLNKFLEGENYVAGNHLTIADLALIATVSNFEVMNYDVAQYKNVARWAAKIKSEAPKYNEINGEGAKAFRAFADNLSKK